MALPTEPPEPQPAIEASNPLLRARLCTGYTGAAVGYPSHGYHVRNAPERSDMGAQKVIGMIEGALGLGVRVSVEARAMPIGR